MTLSNEEVLATIRAFFPLSDWWEADEGTARGPVTLVEKTDDVSYDSWNGNSSGDQAMVFKFGDEFFKVETYSSSFYGADWDTTDHRDYKLTIKKVKRITRSVSYYE